MLRYLEIKAEILHIASAMNPGEKLPDRTTLSKRLDTTRTTVDKAIAELVKEGKLLSHKGSGTYVSGTQSEEGITENWCVIVPDISESVYATLVSGADAFAQQHNINIILCNSNGDQNLQLKYIKRQLYNDVSGFIIVPVITTNVQENLLIYNSLINSQKTFVFCNRSVDGISAPIVTSNDFYGGYIATKHLIGMGYKRIAYVAEQKYVTSIERCKGYISALLENQMDIHRRMIILPDNRKPFHDNLYLIENMIDEEKPDAIFCFNDFVAIQVMNLLKQKKIAISDEIGIIGYDDTESCKSQSPLLSSVSHNTYAIGQMAASVLYRKTHGMSTNEGIDYYLFQPELIIRDSCLGKKR